MNESVIEWIGVTMAGATKIGQQVKFSHVVPRYVSITAGRARGVASSAKGVSPATIQLLQFCLSRSPTSSRSRLSGTAVPNICFFIAAFHLFCFSHSSVTSVAVCRNMMMTTSHFSFFVVGSKLWVTTKQECVFYILFAIELLSGVCMLS